MMAKTANGSALMPETTELATGKNFASVATLLPGGRIQNQTIWVHVEDGKLVLNTETHRQKYLDVEKDPRITVLIRDEEDPYRYAEVRGRVERTETGDRARTQIDELAHRLGRHKRYEGSLPRGFREEGTPHSVEARSDHLTNIRGRGGGRNRGAHSCPAAPAR
jgi:PPOX class probable F420-dependent enzyme